MSLVGVAAVTGLAILQAGCGRSSPIEAAADAMGAAALTSVSFEGHGILGGFRQAPLPGGPWPRHDLRKYAVSIDYGTPAMRVEQVWAQGEHPPRGGSGQPIRGERSSIQLVRERTAWNETRSGTVTFTPGAEVDRLRDLWMSPHGVIRAALASGPEEASGIDGTEFSLTIEGQPVSVVLSDESLVERIHYLVDDPFLGDMPIDIRFEDYRDHGGIRFPHHIVELWDGFAMLDVTVDEVTVNPVLQISVPPEIAEAALAPPPPPPPPAVQATEIARGVWYLGGDNPRSVAVEFADHVVVIDAPNGEERSLAVQSWVQHEIGKPIRYLVNTHHHHDHSGGLRTYVAEGIPIITHEANRAFFEQVFARPHTIRPDRLALNPRPAVIETMTDLRVLSDESRTLELRKIQGSLHAPGYIMAFLPAQRVLIYADSYNPPAGPDPRDPNRTNEFLENLYENLRTLEPRPTLLAPLHGSPIPFENVPKALGLIPF